ncbi:MAG TPA: TolC family protein [Phnomibacter sp.]|nr:TolC family protein [Phnomibacter sp.]
MRYLHSIIFVGLLGATLAGCMVGGKFSKPEMSQSTVQYAQVKDSTKIDTSALVSWFDRYNDPILQGYIRTAIDSNRNLLQASYRIEESRERAGIVKANLYPNFGYSVQAGGGTAGTEALKVGGGVNKGSLKAYGTLNWELDIWGKIRHANQAAYAEYLGDIEFRNALIVSLVAEVATQYFILVDLDNRMKVAQRTLASRKEGTRIITDRFNKGYVAEVDKLQAEQQEALAAVTIPAFERQIITIQNSLRVLMGMPPGNLERGKTLYEQVVTDEIPVGLPSQLLQRRPDIREIERRMEAQFNLIGVAKANMYPSISLTGLVGLASPQLSTFIGGSSFVANGFAGIIGPIFQFGQNKRRVRVQENITKQIGAEYEQVVLEAFADVDNALAEYRTYNDEYHIRSQQVLAARKALDLTQAKYDYGFSSYYEVLIQQNYLFDAELAESITLQQRINSLVFLYKSLGGGW